MATVRWCREAVATDASSPLPVLFRRSPRQAATVTPRLTSETMWTLKKPKPCLLKGSTLMIPRSSRRENLSDGNFRLVLESPRPRDGRRCTVSTQQQRHQDRRF
jgi:hypothetical protein